MACDLPCMSYMALYIISMHIVNSNRSSSSSNHWKLNLSTGKVQPAKTEQEDNGNKSKQNNTSSEKSSNKEASKKYSEKSQEDKMMEILTNKVKKSSDEWIVMAPDTTDSEYMEVKASRDCHASDKDRTRDSGKCPCNQCSVNLTYQKSSTKSTSKSKELHSKKEKPLSCGKRINSTQFDHLRGIADRHLQVHVPEPDVAVIFKSSGKSSEVDMNELEHTLRRAKNDLEKETSHNKREKSAQVYNLIGNFWRIKGNTQNSIECFRKALSLSPEDPDILLNLARVLFNLQFLDDAIFLARRSLHLQPSGQNSWLQHYTLGEILRSSGHLQEATIHFRQALDLNPGFQPAKSHLRDLEIEPSPSVTHLTFLIILFLVVGVLFGIITSVEPSLQDSGLCDGSKTQQRHFNRAMAMRSIKLGINPRLCRLRKINS